MSRAKIEGDEIVIRFPISAIPNAAAIAWERRYGKHDISVIDLEVFATELVIRLNTETEQGDTLVDGMLDIACVNAAECGAFGLSDT